MTVDLTRRLEPITTVGRLDRLRTAFAESGVDALLVTDLANIRYLTGFTGSAGVLLVTGERALLTTDGRYRTQSSEQLTSAGVAGQVNVEIGGAIVQRDAVIDAAGGIGRLGLEADDVSWASQRSWEESFSGVELVPTRGAVQALRMLKDDSEIDRIERAASIADAALAEVLPLLSSAARRPVTEAELGLALDTAMRRLGAEDRAFETIVAAGENSAKPHARPTDRPIVAGDPVVIDFGATFDGYRSDMTRTFSVGGEPAGDMARVFAVVAEAQAAGVAAVRSGTPCGDVDRVCRDVIARAGWADAFDHGTGHGVGLDIHEAPPVGPGGTAILAPGVVVTVEPGVYLPGFGGVRIEDTVVVTSEGCRPLTKFPKDVAV